MLYDMDHEYFSRNIVQTKCKWTGKERTHKGICGLMKKTKILLTLEVSLKIASSK